MDKNNIHVKAVAMMKRFRDLHKSGNHTQFKGAMLSTLAKQFNPARDHPHLPPLLDGFLVMFDQARG